MTEDRLHDIRHSFAHILAAAVLKLFPEARLGVGPVIENGCYYDFLLPRSLTPEDLPKIGKEMKKIIARNLPFERQEVSVEEAKKVFSNQPFKLELIGDLEKYGTTIFDEINKQEYTPPSPPLTKGGHGGVVTLYKTGEFIDLCRGGHVENTKELNPDAFRVDKISGAYWRGDQNREQMQRVYVLAFETKEELEQYLWQREEAKKRDHRKLGQELDLFTFSDLVGPGLPLWTPKGTVIREELEKFAKETEEKWGYQRVATPHIARRKLFETSGHLPYYQDEIFPGMNVRDRGDENEPIDKSDEKDIFRYYLKAMNCPMTMAMFAQKPHSYREFPVRLAEYGTVYRDERAGVLSGLLRVRGFTQNDAHIFCREDQLEDEFVNVMKLHEYYYRDIFKLKDYYVRLSLRDTSKKDKFGGNDAIWEKAESIIRSAIKKSGVPFQEAVGEASFYGPKADFQIKSVIGREETASTNQIDFIMPKRFSLSYTGEDGKDHDVVVIHRAPLGSHERFIAFLIEHYGGAFPLWLAPVQVAVLPIGKAHKAYAKQITKTLQHENMRTVLRDDDETIGKKIRESEMQKIPYLLIVGDKEKSKKTVSVRKRGKATERERRLSGERGSTERSSANVGSTEARRPNVGDTGAVKLVKFLKKVKEEIEKKK